MPSFFFFCLSFLLPSCCKLVTWTPIPITPVNSSPCMSSLCSLIVSPFLCYSVYGCVNSHVSGHYTKTGKLLFLRSIMLLGATAVHIQEWHQAARTCPTVDQVKWQHSINQQMKGRRSPVPESGVGIGPHFLNFLTVGIAAACSQEERIRSNNKTRAEGTVTGASLKTCPRPVHSLAKVLEPC